MLGKLAWGVQVSFQEASRCSLYANLLPHHKCSNLLARDIVVNQCCCCCCCCTVSEAFTFSNRGFTAPCQANRPSVTTFYSLLLSVVGYSPSVAELRHKLSRIWFQMNTNTTPMIALREGGPSYTEQSVCLPLPLLVTLRREWLGTIQELIRKY